MYYLKYWLKDRSGVRKDYRKEFESLESAILFESEQSGWNKDYLSDGEVMGYKEHEGWHAHKLDEGWVLYHPYFEK